MRWQHPSRGLGLVFDALGNRLHVKTLGVEYGQGFHFARPMPLDELLAWLAARESGVGSGAAEVPPFADPTRPIAAQS